MSFSLEHLRSVLRKADPDAEAIDQLQRLIAQGLDQLPQPASGATLQRWQALAAVAEHDLSLAKLYEGHTDALAILHELRAPAPMLSGSSWGTWAAEAPDGRVQIQCASTKLMQLQGRKHWCSGAGQLSHGLLTAWHADGRGPQLMSVAMHHAGVKIDSSNWRAVGMAGSASVEVNFHEVPAQAIGDIGDYLSRPGFWQGGAGVAACWYGGAVGLAQKLHAALAAPASSMRTPFRLAALGKIELALKSTAALLRAAAEWIDAHPQADARHVALRVRLAAETSAAQVLDEAARALGPAALCKDAAFARAAADLPVFIRQSHGERDFAALGEYVSVSETLWPL